MTIELKYDEFILKPMVKASFISTIHFLENVRKK